MTDPTKVAVGTMIATMTEEMLSSLRQVSNPDNIAELPANLQKAMIELSGSLAKVAKLNGDFLASMSELS